VYLVASNEPSDLRRRDADIAIRSFRPTEPEYIAKKISPQKWGIYASNSYCEKIDCQSNTTVIENSDFIGPRDTNVLIQHLGTVGLKLTTANFHITSDNMLVQWQLLCMGHGIAIVPIEIADRNSKLTRLLSESVSLESERWLVSHREMRSNKKVRVVFDLISSELGQKT
jgi:DNA-binding transcriptional LysR family regulator